MNPVRSPKLNATVSGPPVAFPWERTAAGVGELESEIESDGGLGQVGDFIEV